MNEMFASSAAVLWLGILTSISPCPLATNIAAISYIGRQMDRASAVFLAGVAYTLGRAVAYTALGALVVLGLLAIPGLSHFLQRYMSKVLGPVLILIGMYLLGLLDLGLSTSLGSDALKHKAARRGALGAGLLGVLFALSFCPVSAALFFGSLVPISVAQQSRFILPMLFGIGTGLPVIAVAGIIAYSGHALGVALSRLTTFQRWAQRGTGWLFVLVGVYFSIVYIFLA